MTEGEHAAMTRDKVKCGVITVSDSRTEETDESGDLIRSMLLAAGHTVNVRRTVRNDVKDIDSALREELESNRVEVVVITGGTGVSSKDVTIEAVEPFLEKRLDGFGELFRSMSYEKMGVRAMLSRAVAGVSDGKVVFCLPGSIDAARLAMERLIVPGLGHLVHEASK